MPQSRVLLYIPKLISAQFPPETGGPRLLEKFFSRAQRARVQSETEVLRDCFGLPPGALAIAALEWLGQTGVKNQANWWRADPVHLAPDRDQLVMLPQAALAPTLVEMRQIAETFNRNYGTEGFGLEISQPQCGYLRVPMEWHCRSWNPQHLAGRALTEFMPAGADENAVRKLMTEIQMLLHLHPVNQAREVAGQPAINSLWLWGGGALPKQVTSSPARIVSSLPLVNGLAKLAGRSCEPWPVGLSAEHVAGDWLMALSFEDFDQDVPRLERELMLPLWRDLRNGGVLQIRFYPGGDYIHELTRRAARRFWRRPRPVMELLRESDEPPAD